MKNAGKIIAAIEHCIENNCDGCPYQTNTGNCLEDVRKDASECLEELESKDRNHENARRLSLIRCQYGLCPVCKENNVEELIEWHPSKFNTKIFRYHCPKCGVVASKEVSKYD